MGRGKRWSAEESLCLARAWLATSNDPIYGTDKTQGSEIFSQTMYDTFKSLTPQGVTEAQGTYSGRSLSSVVKQWKLVSKECKDFGAVYCNVLNSPPAGATSSEQFVNVAVAIHQKKPNATENMHLYKDCDAASNWIFFLAWKFLKKDRTFSPSLMTPSDIKPPRAAAAAMPVKDERQPEGMPPLAAALPGPVPGKTTTSAAAATSSVQNPTTTTTTEPDTTTEGQPGNSEESSSSNKRKRGATPVAGANLQKLLSIQAETIVNEVKRMREDSILRQAMEVTSNDADLTAYNKIKACLVQRALAIVDATGATESRPQSHQMEAHSNRRV